MSRSPRSLAISEIKKPGTCRIFVFGESAAYGDPQPDFGMPRVLEALLRKRHPGVNFEVVNAAMTAINSHVILPIARDCGRQNGDLWVVYMGNNEVVGPFGAGTVFGPQTPSLGFIRGGLALKTTRTGQFLDWAWRRLSQRQDSNTEWGGMLMFVKNRIRFDDARMEIVYRHFQRNLQDILHAGLRAGVKVVACTVPVNLRDCAPFASMHRPDLTSKEENDWMRLYGQGIEAEKAGKPGEAAGFYAQAGQIDATHAELQFRWGRSCLALGQIAEAQQHLALARDYDALRFRADARLNDIIRQNAQGREPEGVHFMDAQEMLARQSRDGLPGADAFYEHVHFTFEGNYWLAKELASKLSGLLPGWVASQSTQASDWMTLAECAQELVWTDYNRYDTASSVLLRLSDPPFTTQLNHAEQCQKLRGQLNQLLPAIQPAGLRQAAERYREAVRKEPGDWVFQSNLGTLQQKIGDLSGSMESWKKVGGLLPHHDEVHCQLGALLNKQNRSAEAVEEYQQALSRQPQSRQALNGLGTSLHQQGKYNEAIQVYERALKLSPDFAETRVNLGNTLAALGRTEEARNHYRVALKHKPNIPGALVALANICVIQGWSQEAVETYESALKLSPVDAMAHLALGNVLATLGRHPEALGHFTESVRLNPGLAEAHFKLGFALGRQGRDDLALERFSEAVRLKPDLMEARLNLGIALFKQRRTAEAASHFQEVLRISPGNSLAKKYLDAIANKQAKP